MNLDIIIGKPVSEAKRIAVMANHEWRVVTDGPSFISETFIPNRVNLTVVNGLVESYRIG